MTKCKYKCKELHYNMTVKIIKKDLLRNQIFLRWRMYLFIYLKGVSVMSNTKINIRKCTLIIYTMNYIQAYIFNLRDLIIEIKGI